MKDKGKLIFTLLLLAVAVGALVWYYGIKGGANNGVPAKPPANKSAPAEPPPEPAPATTGG